MQSSHSCLHPDRNLRLECFLQVHPGIKEEKPATWTVDYSAWIKQQIAEAADEGHHSLYYGWYDNSIVDQGEFNKYLFKKFDFTP